MYLYEKLFSCMFKLLAFGPHSALFNVIITNIIYVKELNRYIFDRMLLHVKHRQKYE